MTLAEIEALPKTMLLATDISDYLCADPSVIRWQAKHDPSKLGFPVIVIGSRIKIPKDAFVSYCRHGRQIDYSYLSEILAIKIINRLKGEPCPFDCQHIIFKELEIEEQADK